MKKFIMAVFLVFMIFGCSSLPKHMTVSTNLNIQSDRQNAKIIFFRPGDNLSASARFIEINEIKNNNINYIGYLSFGSGIIYNAKPGKHIFAIFNGLPNSYRWMSIYHMLDDGTSSSFEINVEAGKYYYVEVKTFKPYIIPINQSNIDKLKKLNNITWAYPNEQAKKIIEENAEKYYKSWLTAVEKKQIFYMRKEDGLNKWFGKNNSNSTSK